MRYFTLVFIFTFFSCIDKASGQKFQSDAEKKLVITIDYLTGNIVHSLQSGNHSKKIRPKVGSYITIKVINLPESYSASGEIEFENGNIEGAGVFNGFFKPDAILSPKQSTTDGALPAPDSIKKAADKAISVAVKEIDKKSQQEIDDVVQKSNKPTKINVENLVTSLQIGNVSNFLFDKKIISDTLFSKPENKVKLNKAKEDYADQKRLIKIAQENLTEKIYLKDSVIKELIKIADSLNVTSRVVVKPIVHSAPPIFDVQVPNSDISSIKVVIKKEGKVTNELPLSFYNKAGYKIDFSTGFFHTRLQDQEYKIINKQISINNSLTTVDSIFQIKQKDKGKGQIAIGVLAHYYPRLLSYFNIGISGGFSYQTDNKVLNFLMGTSFLFGNQQRFIISGGAAFGKVKQLDENFAMINTDYHKNLLSDKTEIPMTEKLKTSLFIGVSYNLGTINNTKSIKRSF